MEKLRSRCGECELHERCLKVKRLPVSGCIVVENANQNTTKEVIKMHFENSKNGGGVIDNIIQKKDRGYVLIYFEDFENAVLVQTKSHRLDGKDLDVSIYHESLGRGQIQATFTLPQPIVLEALYNDILRCIQSIKPEMSALEKQMRECNTNVKWPRENTGSVALECGLSPTIKNYREHSSNWPVRAKKKFEDVTKWVSKRTITVKPDLFDDLVQELSSINVSNPDRVAVFPMKRTHSIDVVGHAENVLEVKGVLNEKLATVEREHTVVDRAESIQPHILQLLLVSNWMNTVEAKYKGINVTCNIHKNQVCFHGMKKLVDGARKESLKFVNAVQSGVVCGIPQWCLPLYSNQEVKDYITQKLKTAGLPVVYEVSKEKLHAYGTDKNMLSRGITIIEESVKFTEMPSFFPYPLRTTLLKLKHKGRLLVTTEGSFCLKQCFIVSTDDIHNEVVNQVLGQQ